MKKKTAAPKFNKDGSIRQKPGRKPKFDGIMPALEVDPSRPSSIPEPPPLKQHFNGGAEACLRAVAARLGLNADAIIGEFCQAWLNSAAETLRPVPHAKETAP